MHLLTRKQYRCLRERKTVIKDNLLRYCARLGKFPWWSHQAGKALLEEEGLGCHSPCPMELPAMGPSTSIIRIVLMVCENGAVPVEFLMILATPLFLASYGICSKCFLNVLYSLLYSNCKRQGRNGTKQNQTTLGKKTQKEQL